MSLAVKKKLYNNRYEKMEELGKGSFGAVLKARVVDYAPESKPIHDYPLTINQ